VVSVLRKEDILALGYREVDHGGFCWLANDQGKRFVMEVDDWSFQGLATRNGWKRWKRAYHTVHLGCDKQGITYLIKNYPPKKYEARPFARRTNRARKEFLNTLIVFKEHIQTVVPIALGEDKESGRQGIIIYPFLDQAVTLARLYVHKEVKGISVRDRHFLEKTVGRMVQRITARGIFPRDLGIDHFLAERDTGGQLSVHWVDLERVKFISLFKKRIGIVHTVRYPSLYPSLIRAVSKLGFWYRMGLL